MLGTSVATESFSIVSAVYVDRERLSLSCKVDGYITIGCQEQEACLHLQQGSDYVSASLLLLFSLILCALVCQHSVLPLLSRTWGQNCLGFCHPAPHS